MRFRHNLYFDREVTQSLEAIARREGGNKSRIVNDVLQDWMGRRHAKDIDTKLQMRLDRMSLQDARNAELSEKCLERISYVLEAVMLFVRYELTVTASFPENDHAALMRGNERYERFVAQLGRQIAAGGTRLAANDDPVGEGRS